MSAPRRHKIIPVDAIERIVGYLYRDEEKDCACDDDGNIIIPRNHIFRSVKQVADWLDERRHAERWKRCDTEA